MSTDDVRDDVRTDWRRAGAVGACVAALLGLAVMMRPDAPATEIEVVGTPADRAPSEATSTPPAPPAAAALPVGAVQVAWPDGPSQSAQEASAQSIPAAVAALPLAERIEVEEGLWTEEGLYVTSTLRRLGQDVLGDAAGEQWIDWVDGSYAEILLLDHRTMGVVHAWPIGIYALGSIVSSPDAVYVGAGPECCRLGSSVVRIDRSDRSIVMRVFPAGEGVSNPDERGLPFPWVVHEPLDLARPSRLVVTDDGLFFVGDGLLELDPDTGAVIGLLHDRQHAETLDGVYLWPLGAGPDGTVITLEGVVAEPRTLAAVDGMPSLVGGAVFHAEQLGNRLAVLRRTVDRAGDTTLDVLDGDGVVSAQVLDTGSNALHAAYGEVVLTRGGWMDHLSEAGGLTRLAEVEAPPFARSVVAEAVRPGWLRWIVGSTLYEVPIRSSTADEVVAAVTDELARTMRMLVRTADLPVVDGTTEVAGGRVVQQLQLDGAIVELELADVARSPRDALTAVEGARELDGAPGEWQLGIGELPAPGTPGEREVAVLQCGDGRIVARVVASDDDLPRDAGWAAMAVTELVPCWSGLLPDLTWALNAELVRLIDAAGLEMGGGDHDQGVATNSIEVDGRYLGLLLEDLGPDGREGPPIWADFRDGGRAVVSGWTLRWDMFKHHDAPDDEPRRPAAVILCGGWSLSAYGSGVTGDGPAAEAELDRMRRGLRMLAEASPCESAG